MPDNFGRMTSSEASKKLQDFCCPKKCKRCGQAIELDAPTNVSICGRCADDLRQEEEAEIESIALADKARQEQQAYEDYKAEEQFRHTDDGGGWRYC